MNRFAVDHSRGRIVLKAPNAEAAIAQVKALTPGSTGHYALPLPTATPAAQVATKPRTVDHSRPRVDLQRRLVLVHSPNLGSYHLYTITAVGGIAKSPAEQVVLRDTAIEACKAMGVSFAGFQAVNGIKDRKFPSAADQVIAIWREAERQFVTMGSTEPSKPQIMSKKTKTKETLGEKVEKAAKKPDPAPKKKAAAKPAPKTPKPAKAAKPAKDGMSGLDAAAKVLAQAGGPLNAKEIIEAIQKDGLAPGLGGKTPHATIYAGMITEMAKKGKESRFKRGAEKGTFEFNETGA